MLWRMYPHQNFSVTLAPARFYLKQQRKISKRPEKVLVYYLANIEDKAE